MLHGTYYQTNVTLYDKGKAVGTTPVKVLLVDYVTCNFLGAGCVPTPAGEKDQSTLYAGVGFNRNNMTGTSVAGLNPLVNVKLMSGQQLEPGYIVGNNAVTIGLSQTTTAGFSFVKLTQDVATSIPGVPQWNQTVMTVAAGGATGSGSVLLDAGIGYMFLSPPSGSSLDALPNRALAPDGTLVEIWLPGQNGSAASYSFKARQAATCTPDAANSLNPCNVTITHDGAPFVNTSRAFFSAFDYLYDPINGYLGYRSGRQRLHQQRRRHASPRAAGPCPSARRLPDHAAGRPASIHDPGAFDRRRDVQCRGERLRPQPHGPG